MKKITKKLLMLLLVVFSLSVLYGCGEDAKQDTPDNTPTDTVASTSTPAPTATSTPLPVVNAGNDFAGSDQPKCKGSNEHVFKADGDYFGLVLCENGCKKYGRPTSEQNDLATFNIDLTKVERTVLLSDEEAKELNSLKTSLDAFIKEMDADMVLLNDYSGFARSSTIVVKGMYKWNILFDRNGLDFLKEFLDVLTKKSNNTVDFYAELSDVFKNGRYIVRDTEGAFAGYDETYGAYICFDSEMVTGSDIVETLVEYVVLKNTKGNKEIACAASDLAMAMLIDHLNAERYLANGTVDTDNKLPEEAAMYAEYAYADKLANDLKNSSKSALAAFEYAANVGNKSLDKLFAEFVKVSDNTSLDEVSKKAGFAATAKDKAKNALDFISNATFKHNCEVFGHEFDFVEGDYISFADCKWGCGTIKRQPSLNLFDQYVYDEDFQSDAKEILEKSRDRMLEILENAPAYDEAQHAYSVDSELVKEATELKDLYDTFKVEIHNYRTRGTFAYLRYSIELDESANTAYTDYIKDQKALYFDFCKILGSIHESCYRDFFYREEFGWTERKIEEALNDAEIAKNDEYQELTNRMTEITTKVKSMSGSESTIEPMYEEYLGLAKKVADILEWDDYMDLAYVSSYGRGYTPDDVKKFSDYVKKYIVPLTEKIDTLQGTWSSKAGSREINAAFSAGQDSKLCMEYVIDFFKTMKSDDFKKPIDFYKEANDMFMRGLVFNGKMSAAYSNGIEGSDGLIYFKTDEYRSASTFVHEFGHHYANFYNAGIDADMDLLETHSQGDEMLFLAYLQEHLPESEQGYAKFSLYSSISEMLESVLIGAMVNEFEYCIYKNVDLNGNYHVYKNGEYAKLWVQVAKLYGFENINTAYWALSAFGHPCYYISYAMSAVPSIALYLQAAEEGFEKAQHTYFALQAYTDPEDSYYIDYADDPIYTVSYDEILERVGMQSPFDEEIFIRMCDFFGVTIEDTVIKK
ncbi:MAG: hypothetical protein MJ113_00910 [Lachnospiraceae bacterium]|nr:hypothetical protein [Lachnospiraceae bacterium]